MKLNKIMAFSMAAAMVVGGPVAAFATSTGNATIEVDRSSGVEFFSVQLDTAPTNSDYTFYMDPSQLLSTYDSTISKSTLYFDGVQKTAAALTNKNTAKANDGKIYIRSVKSGVKPDQYLKSNDDGDGLVFDSDKYDANKVGKFYVWTPKSSGVEGELTQLTDTNVNQYLTATYKETVKNGETTYTVSNIKVNTDYKRFVYDESGNKTQSVCDGKIYGDQFTAMTAKDDLTQYGSFSGDGKTFTPKADTLYVQDKTSKAYSALSTAITTSGDEIVLTPATKGYSDKSKTYTITNKSSFDLAVGVDVTITNLDLPLASSTTTAATDAAYVAFTDGTTPSYAKAYYTKDDGTDPQTTKNDDHKTYKDTEISANFTIAATDVSSAITYQDKTGDSDPQILGHAYKKFMAYGGSYNSATYYMTGAANAAYQGWSDFVDNFGSKAKPTISVVYRVNALIATAATKTEGSAPDQVTYNTYSGTIPGWVENATTVPTVSVDGTTVEAQTALADASALGSQAAADGKFYFEKTTGTFRYSAKSTASVIALTVDGKNFNFKASSDTSAFAKTSTDGAFN